MNAPQGSEKSGDQVKINMCGTAEKAVSNQHETKGAYALSMTDEKAPVGRELTLALLGFLVLLHLLTTLSPLLSHQKPQIFHITNPIFSVLFAYRTSQGELLAKLFLVGLTFFYALFEISNQTSWSLSIGGLHLLGGIRLLALPQVNASLKFAKTQEP
ncbi:hypothetical protein ACFFLM_12160 [Deinococcus oregonensis]|uniref:Uncharacterized protein n=1 Tax=Deinococcus oregonensis TaxID=1805970 RepID=A0ABV6B0D4_9DEIO